MFLEYDGTLSPVVDWPQDAVISESMREAVRVLAGRCTVCIVSGRDRPVVQELMGVDDLLVAACYGFDIWSPAAGTLEHEASGGFDAFLERVTTRVRDEADAIDGALIETKKASVAVHYRLVSDSERPRIKALVDRPLAEHADELKVTPARWCTRFSSSSTGPTRTRPRLRKGTGIGVLVADPDDPELAGRRTAAELVLTSVKEVE